jgi:hypothetical protein
MIARHGEHPPANEYIPPETNCIKEDLWRAACKAGCISEGGPGAERMAFKRGAKKLHDRGRIGICQPWVWVVRL